MFALPSSWPGVLILFPSRGPEPPHIWCEWRFVCPRRQLEITKCSVRRQGEKSPSDKAFCINFSQKHILIYITVLVTNSVMKDTNYIPQYYCLSQCRCIAFITKKVGFSCCSYFLLYPLYLENKEVEKLLNSAVGPNITANKNSTIGYYCQSGLSIVFLVLRLNWFSGLLLLKGPFQFLLLATHSCCFPGDSYCVCPMLL